MYVFRNTDMCSWNHCFRGNRGSESVFVALVIQQAVHLYGPTLFFRISSRFLGKKLLNVQCMISSETFVIIRRIEDIVVLHVFFLQ